MNESWNSYKTSEDFETKVLAKISELKDKANRHSLSLKRYWLTIPKPQSVADVTPVVESLPPKETNVTTCEEVPIPSTIERDKENKSIKNHAKPVQKLLSESIDVLNGDLVGSTKQRQLVCYRLNKKK